MRATVTLLTPSHDGVGSGMGGSPAPLAVRHAPVVPAPAPPMLAAVEPSALPQPSQPSSSRSPAVASFPLDRRHHASGHGGGDQHHERRPGAPHADASTSGREAPTHFAPGRKAASASIFAVPQVTQVPRVPSRQAGPDSPPDPAALTSWIKSARHVPRLQRLVKQYGHIMNHIHVSAVIAHLSQMASSDAAAAVALAAAAPPAAPSSSGNGNRDPARASFDPGATTPAGSPTAATVLVGEVATPEDTRALLATLLSLLAAQLPHFEPRQIANSAWALGRWPPGVPGRDEALASLAAAAEPQLRRFRPQELANMLHGVAAAGASAAPGGSTSGPASAAFLSAHARAVASRLRAAAAAGTPPVSEGGSSGSGSASGSGSSSGGAGFKAQELASLLWSWGVLLGGADAGHTGPGLAPPSPSPSGPSAASDSPPAAAASASAVAVLPVREVLAAQLRSGLVGAGPQELANSVHGLARLQVVPPPAWFGALLSAAAAHLATPDSAAAGGRSATGRKPSVAGSAPPRAGFSPQELSNLLWGCSKLRLRLPPAFLDDVAPCLERCLPYMDLAERVNVLWALAWQAKLGAAEAEAEGQAAFRQPEVAVASRGAADEAEAEAAEPEDGEEGVVLVSPLPAPTVASTNPSAALADAPPQMGVVEGLRVPHPQPTGQQQHASTPQQHHLWPNQASPPLQPGVLQLESFPRAPREEEPVTERHAGGSLAHGTMRRVLSSVLEAAQHSTPAPQDVSVTLWSLATLACEPLTASSPPLPSSPAAALASPPDSALLSKPEAAALCRLWSSVALDLTPQGQANAVWAAMRLGLALPTELQDRLAAWLRRHSSTLAPPETAALARGLGALGPRLAPSAELTPAVAALVESAYLRRASYGLCELAQVVYGGALLLRSMARQADYGEVAAADGGGGGAAEAMPAALEVRMSLDLEDDFLAGSASDLPAASAAAAAVAAAVRQQQRRLAQPLDWLVVQLQAVYRRSGKAAVAGAKAAAAAGPDAAAPPAAAAVAAAAPCSVEELVMTLSAVGMLMPEHLSPARGTDLAAWTHDLARQYGRIALAAVPYPPHVRHLAPLLHAIALAAVGSVRAARARRRAAAESRRRAAASAGVGPASSMDEFLRSGRNAIRQEELRQSLQAQRQQNQRMDALELQAQPPPQPQPQPQPQAQPSAAVHQAANKPAASRPAPPQPAPAAPAPAATNGTSASRSTANGSPNGSPGGAEAEATVGTGTATWRASGLTTDWLQRFWAASAPTLAEASPREAAMLMWALAALSVRPPDRWAAALLAAVRPHLGRGGGGGSSGGGEARSGGGGGVALSDQTLGVMLASLGALRLAPPADWLAAAVAEVEARAMPPPPPAGATGAPGVVAPHSLMDPRALAGALEGLAGLGADLPREWLPRLLRCWLAPQVGRLLPVERSRLYLAVVELDPDLADRLGHNFCELSGGAGAGRGPGGAAGRARAQAALGLGSDEGAGQQRALFSRSRGGWR
ncbi:hypothetical protein HYH03_004796 [Edaphochlamys debaryana]|uniref:Uncharacterized protein n=1 Tax=Edaphochlamys debaryana TaxID=47281 RepID=A0A835Y6G3_9CHLO|nr:hypothetical protein HYH03_004796 [Edaphochlamys debaryana]|eukprot:KAG2497207.1 hypothetical protein HYH03_004796 [Edaphochlamys debaryana]